jgi:hypothetical protein
LIFCFIIFCLMNEENFKDKAVLKPYKSKRILILTKIVFTLPVSCI